MSRQKRKRGVSWQDGDERTQRAVDRWVWEPDSMPIKRLHTSSRRTLFRLPTPQELTLGQQGEAVARSLMIKVHHSQTGTHLRRERLKRRIGWSPAWREWLALVELHGLGVPVPKPLAWGRLPNRDPIVVTEYCPGRNLGAVLETATPAARSDWIDRLASCIVLLHRTGFRHGDLHLGNLHAQADRIILTDLQRSRRARGRRDRLRDIAHIDLSLARAGFDIDLRLRLRHRVEATGGLDDVARAFVADFVRGRTRKDLRPGRTWAAWKVHSLVGMRDRAMTDEALCEALGRARYDPQPEIRRGGRTQMSLVPARSESDTESIVVKRMRTSSPLGAVGERIAGSDARRAFRTGQQLALLGQICARPLAFLEERGGLGPYSNWLFLEAVGRQDLDEYRPESEARALQCAAELMQWIAEWQAWGIEHRDLKASNIRLDADGPHFRFWLVDLEDIRMRRGALSDRSRFRTLAQLGASLDDEAFSIAARRRGLDLYLERLPFARSNSESWKAALVRETLARNHRWRAVGCRLRPDEARPPNSRRD